MDLSQLMELAILYRKNMLKRVITCEAFVKKMPSTRKFLVMAGTEKVRNSLINFKFSKDDIEKFKEFPIFKEIFSTTNFEEFLKDFRFTGDMRALAEGEIVFAGEPLIQITGTLPEICVARACIFPMLSTNIDIASKAARIILVSRGKEVLDFSNSMEVARNSYLSGFSATSNIDAGIKFHIPVIGSMSNMLVVIQGERQAYKNFQETFRSAILPIDTYDPISAASMDTCKNVYLRYGNLELLSRCVRSILNINSYDTKIVVLGQDEYKIDQFIRCGTPVDTFVVEKIDVGNLDIVYEVVYDDTNDKPLSNHSMLIMPGKKQIFLDQREGGWSHLVALDNMVQETEYLTPLLDDHIKSGKIVEDNIVDLGTSRRYCNAALANLHPKLTSINDEEIKSPVYPDESINKMFMEFYDGLAVE